MEVDPCDWEKTAFTTPLGQVFDSLLIYLNDVIVYSPDLDSHLQHVEAVFEQLQKYGLKLQLNKCQFFKKKFCYLGYVVSKEGFAPDPEKLQVKDWKPPTTVQQVSLFLGFAGYYRHPFYFLKLHHPCMRYWWALP